MPSVRLLAAAAVALLPVPAVAVAAPAAPASAVSPAADSAIAAAIAGDWRSAANRARDRYRHPLETLEFFGLEPAMTVIEVAPGRGWYSEILAPVLKAKGQLIAAVNDPAGSARAKQAWDSYASWLAEHRAVLGPVRMVAFGKGVTEPLAAPGSVDLVVTFRNSHDWQSSGFAADAFAAFYRALKPGGVLGVVDHRLPESRAVPAEAGHSSYVKESAVIAAAEQAGFRLAGRSEINANPKDTADWPKDVFTLPPTLALGDVDRAKYLAIGESDRMTLKFVKPADSGQ